MSDISFKDFGKHFQERVMQALLSDHSWAQQMVEVMRASYFEQAYLRYLFEVYFKYWQQYKCFPTLQNLLTMVKVDLKEGNDEVLCQQIVEYIKRIKTNPDMNDLPWVKDRSLNFCKNQALREALEQAVDLAQEEKHETIVEIIKKAITVGTPNSAGHDFFEDAEARFIEEERSIVATGIKQLDDKFVMNGGLGKGEIGVIVAPTGVGKSHFLVNIGANALRAGKNVLHYTFELRENKLSHRYDSNLCSIPASEVPSEKDFILKRYGEMKNDLGRLIVKEYPTNSASVLTLRSHIEKLAITKQFVPDVVIVDYADIMRSTRQFDSLRHELKLIYEELRGMGMDLGIPVWTASQSNRESTNQDVVGTQHMAESFAKAMVCDFVITLSRKPLQKVNGLGNLFVAKNRLGKDGILFPVRLDTSMSTIEIMDGEVDLDELQKTHDTGLKKLMKDKWTEVGNDRLLELRSVSTNDKIVKLGATGK